MIGSFSLDPDTMQQFLWLLLHSIWLFLVLAIAAEMIGRWMGTRNLNRAQVAHHRYCIYVAALLIGLAALPALWALLGNPMHQAGPDTTMSARESTRSSQPADPSLMRIVQNDG